MSASHSYRPISHQDDDDDDDNASINELVHHPLADEAENRADTEDAPLVQNSTTSRSFEDNPTALTTTGGEDSSDEEGGEEGNESNSARGYSGAPDRFNRLRGADQNHPLADYDLDDDIYAEDIVVVGPSVEPSKPQPHTIRPGVQSNDGVFSNIPAKPTVKSGEEAKEAEMPPPYEEVAQDASPPYFDTTVIATSDDPEEVLVEGLPVGGGFSFFWNMLISMSFQFVGFVLTYLLHTTHAAKNGSRAGLGITFIQYGLYMRTKEFQDDEMNYYDGLSPEDAQAEADAQASRNVWLSYFLMILGWFIIIRSTGEYIRVRRMLAAYLYSPEAHV